MEMEDFTALHLHHQHQHLHFSILSS
jgi:hypothetical protein